MAPEAADRAAFTVLSNDENDSESEVRGDITMSYRESLEFEKLLVQRAISWIKKFFSQKKFFNYSEPCLSCAKMRVTNLH